MILRLREDGRGRTKGPDGFLSGYKFIFNHKIKERKDYERLVTS